MSLVLAVLKTRMIRGEEKVIEGPLPVEDEELVYFKIGSASGSVEGRGGNEVRVRFKPGKRVVAQINEGTNVREVGRMVGVSAIARLGVDAATFVNGGEIVTVGLVEDSLQPGDVLDDEF